MMIDSRSEVGPTLEAQEGSSLPPLPPYDPQDQGDKASFPSDPTPYSSPTPPSPQLSFPSPTRRFPAWVVLLVSSILALISLALGRRNDTAAEKWAVSLLALSMVGSLLGVLCYMYARSCFLSTAATYYSSELILTILLFALWCAILPIVMKPSNSLAVGFTQVVNANLFIASWACFCCVFWIVGDLLQNVFAVSSSWINSVVVKPAIRSRRSKWYTLVASSAIVLAASVRVYQAFRCDLQEMRTSPTCQDSKYAIAAAVIGTVMTLAVLLMGCIYSARSSQVMENVLSVILLILNSVLLGFVTFGEGPGHSIGNLWASTWVCFLLSCLLVAESYRGCCGIRDNVWMEPTTAIPSSSNEHHQQELPQLSNNAIDGDEGNNETAIQDL